MAYGRVNVGGTIPKVLNGSYSISKYGRDAQEVNVFNTTEISNNWSCLVFDISSMEMTNTSYTSNKDLQLSLDDEVLSINGGTRAPAIYLKMLTLYKINEGEIRYKAYVEEKANDVISKQFSKEGIIYKNHVSLIMKQTAFRGDSFNYSCYSKVYFQK